ncbi:LacI family DNA-binding transcriptional regulator [Kribbella sp. NPDC051770]|uniref:LacI family DNA-binding transcriptional regulator n=1 Tax=Kribbella sp. NPDC051770 TaxID=3155413 RepID=UPI003442EC20
MSAETGDDTAGMGTMPAGEGKPRPTILDVAAEAGLSRSVVSRALTGTGSVSEAARSQALAAAERLGYRPNTAARTLVTGRSKTIGALIRKVTDPGYSHLIVGLQERATHHAYRVLTVTGNLDVDSERAGLDTLLSLQVDGLVIGSGKLPPETISKVANRVPTATCWRQVPGVDSVQVDEQRSADALFEHLATLNHQHVAVLAVRNHFSAEARLAAIAQAAERHDLKLLHVDAGYDLDECTKATALLLQTNPEVTAVIALSGWGGVGALTALEAAGLQAPRDMSVACFNAVLFDDIPQLDLTAMAQSHEEAAALAVDLIMDRLADRGRPAQHRTIQSTLHRGKTTGPARTRALPASRSKSAS